MSANGGRSRSADVVILTAIPLEYQAALQVETGAVEGSHWEEERLPNGLRVSFRPFHGKKAGRPLRVALVAAGGMGAVEATHALLPVVLAYHPRCVAMCGVCAGHPRKTNLGDVIAADRLFFHDTGKRHPEGVQQDLTTYNLRHDWKEDLKHFDFTARFQDAPWWLSRPVPYEWQESWALLRLHAGVLEPWTLPDFKQSCPQWEKVIEGLWESGHVQPRGASLTDKGRERLRGLLFQHRGSFPDLSPTGGLLPFRVHVDPMGSGGQVLEDVSYWDTVTGYMRKTAGLEMEAAALGALAHAQSHLKLDALVMKGVMDHADAGRDDHFKEYAARASAECLLAFLREHLDVEVVPGVDDLLRTGSAGEPPQDAPPSALLNARHEVVPFHGRHTVITELGRWCEEGPPVAVRLLHAEGGVGKTRLAIELVRRRRAQGWSAGFLAKELPSDWLEKLWSLGQPVLVVLDYAESHPTLSNILSRLLQYAAQQGSAALRRIRLLLLARNDGDWWRSLRQRDTELGTWLGTATVHALPPLAISAAERLEVFREAAERFAARLGKPRVQGATEPGLSDEHFERVLYVHMAALAAVEGLTFEASTLMEVILDHEERCWELHAGQALAGLVVQRSLARQLVAAATLRGGLVDRAEVAQVAGRLVPAPLSRDEEALLLLLSWVYQQPGDGAAMALPALEPDLLGEAFVLRIASQHGPEWIDRVLPPDVPGHVAATGLQVLGRASAMRAAAVRPWMERLLAGHLLHERAGLALLAAKAVGQRTAFSVLGEVLADRLEAGGDAARAQQLRAIGVPFPTVSLARVGEWMSRTRLGALSSQQDEEVLDERAQLLIELGRRQGALGQRAEALRSTSEAVSLRRILAERDPDTFLPHLATSLSNLSVMLGELGRREEALEAASEAVALHRGLAERDTDFLWSELARGLDNLGVMLSRMGQQQKALEATSEAVWLRRGLAERDPDTFLPSLAKSLNNLGNRLGELERREEALEATAEAVALHRGLAERNPDIFQYDLASNLHNLCLRLSGMGQRQEALRASDEAVALIRRLAAHNLDAYQSLLASTLLNRGFMLGDMGRRKEALETSAEAVACYRELAARDGEAFQPDLAGGLDNLSLNLNALGRRDEALKAATEAVGLRRRLVERNPAAFQADLASSLDKLSLMLGRMGRQEEALRSMEEAVALYRGLAERNPGTFQPSLASSLSNLSVVLGGLGQQQRALEAAIEAVVLFRRLAEPNMRAFQHDLARSLNNLGLMLRDMGLRLEALEATDEAVRLRRGLVERNPDAFQPDLASSVHNLGIMLNDLRHHEEALEAAAEAVRLRRGLAERNPDAYQPELAISLHSLSVTMSHLSRTEEALQAELEAAETLWPLFQRFPGPLAHIAEALSSELERLHESLRRPVPPELQERLATFKRLTSV